MAIAHDAAATGTWTNFTSGTYTFAYTPAGTAKGVVLFVSFNDRTGSPLTAVTYGGVAMTHLGEANDAFGEHGVTDCWFIGASIPTGTQNIVVSGSGIDTKFYTVASVSAAASTDTSATLVGTGAGNDPDPFLPVDSVADTAQRYAQVWSGKDAVSDLTIKSGFTKIGDSGTTWSTGVAISEKEDATASGSISTGWTQSGSASCALCCVWIKEAAAPVTHAGAATLATTALAALHAVLLWAAAATSAAAATISAIGYLGTLHLGTATIPASATASLAASPTYAAAATLAGSASLVKHRVNAWTQLSQPSIVVGYIDQSHTFNGHPMRHDFGKWVWNNVTGKAYAFDGYGETGGNWSDSDGNIYSRAIWEYDPGPNTLTLLRVCNWSYVASLTTPLSPENTNVPTPWSRHPYGTIDVCPERNSLILVGGADSHMSAGDVKVDLWEFAIATRSWARIGHHDTTHSGVAVYDTNIPNSVTDVFEQATVWDSNLKKIILFGARNDGTNKSRNVFSFDPATNTWVDKGFSGAPTAEWSSHGACFDSVRNVMWMFGGGVSASRTDNLYKYDLNSNTWTQITKAGAWPAARNWGNLAFDPFNDVLVMYGGSLAGGGAGDTWIFDPNSSAWTDVSPGSGPSGADTSSLNLIYDNFRKQLLLRSSVTQNEGIYWSYVYNAPSVKAVVTASAAASIPASASVSSLAAESYAAASSFSASGTIAAAATVDAAGTTHQGTASLSSLGAVLAAGSLAGVGSSTVDGTGGVSAAASMTAVGASTVGASGIVSANAVMVYARSANFFAEAYLINPNPHAEVSGPVYGTVYMWPEILLDDAFPQAVHGAIVYGAISTVSGGVTASVASTATYAAGATLPGTASISASGSVLLAATGTVGGSVALDGSGTVFGPTASAAMSSSASMEATGAVLRSAMATIAASGSIAASGTTVFVTPAQISARCLLSALATLNGDPLPTTNEPYFQEGDIPFLLSEIGQQEGDIPMLLSDTGQDVSIGSDVTKGFIERVTRELLQGTAASVAGTDIFVLIQTGTLPGLAIGVAIGVDGQVYAVREVELIGDGALTQILCAVTT